VQNFLIPRQGGGILFEMVVKKWRPKTSFGSREGGGGLFLSPRGEELFLSPGNPLYRKEAGFPNFLLFRGTCRDEKSVSREEKSKSPSRKDKFAENSFGPEEEIPFPFPWTEWPRVSKQRGPWCRFPPKKSGDGGHTGVEGGGGKLPKARGGRFLFGRKKDPLFEGGVLSLGS